MMRLALSALLVAETACGKEVRPAPQPDELPTVIGTELPFKYPAAFYAQKLQGDVVLSMYIDSTGRVLPDSIRVNKSSGWPVLDSAAATGARQLRFNPARLKGKPMGMSVMFPVYYRYPSKP